MFSFDKEGYLRGYESWYRICNRDIVSLWWLLIRFVRRNNMTGFIIWSLFGVFIIVLGIKDMFSKNPVVKKSK